jgi:hypothetical protein
MSDQIWLNGTLAMLKEAVEGGAPGQQTMFINLTEADGSGNHGLIATLAQLGAAQASDPTTLGVSVAAHTSHLAFHLSVVVRWVGGDRGPFDWHASFQPGPLDEAGWTALQQRAQSNYQALLTFVDTLQNWDTVPTVLIGALAHVVYHLGAIRQVIKLV